MEDLFDIISKKKIERSLSKIQLLRTTTVKELEFYFWNMFSKFHPKFFSKGTILHNRYSSLLSESLINLARDGYRLQKVDLPKIKPMKISKVKQVDIAPTILSLLNVEIPKYMEGNEIQLN